MSHDYKSRSSGFKMLLFVTSDVTMLGGAMAPWRHNHGGHDAARITQERAYIHMMTFRLFYSPLWLLLLVRTRVLAIAHIDDLLKELYSPADVKKIRDGQLLQDTVESGSERELTARFAALVKMPTESFQKVFIDVSKKKETDPSVIDLGLIEQEEGSIQDFDGVKLEPKKDDMVKAYINAKPGSELNLSQEEIDIFNSLNNTEQVEHQFRSMLLNRYRKFRQHGLKGIPPYRRGGGVDYHPHEELARKAELAKIIKREAPEFHRHLSEYPKNKPEGLEESFLWINFEVDGKPTISLVHRMGRLEGDVYVFAERHYYVGRSHNCVHGIGGAFPVDEGTVLLYLVRTTTDQVAGFGSSAKRAIGSRIMGGQMAANFERARASMEPNEKEL